ncbi:hypothetical protein [Terrisporobacter sp.]
MLLLVMFFIGVLIFIPSIYLFIKNYKMGKYIKRYGLISYFGLAIAYLGVILSMESIFRKLPGILPVFMTLIIFIVLGKLLLKPTFLKNK